MTAPTPTVESVTIDRGRRARIVVDLMYDIARQRPGAWWVGATVVGFIALGVAGNVWYAGVAVLLLAAATQLLVWWARVARAARQGLAVGDTVSVGYADGQLTVTDRTGEVRLPRGSALLVRRTGRNATVFGRSISFVLPGELLSEEDVAFLEGGGASSEDSASVLPLRVRVTETIQGQIVSAATRVTVRSADFLLPYVVAGGFATLGVVTELWGLLWVSGVLLLLTLPMLRRLAKMRAAFRKAYPLGWTLRARVASDHLTLTRRHATVVIPWSTYEAVKATDDVVLLRHTRRRFAPAQVEVLPLELFGPDELRVLAEAVPGHV